MALSRRREAIQWVANLPVFRPAGRVRILRRAGMDLGEGVLVLSGILVSHDGPIVIGEGSWLNHGVYIDTAGGVEIGRRVGIGSHVRILTATHEIGNGRLRAGEWVTKAVRIGDGCWVGASVTILPGVTIAPGCVIGAGSLVTTDTEPDGLYVGVPARRVRDLGADEGRIPR